ncbi:MAG: lactate utilization protein [Desulfobacterales bacterium]|nr:lactate utilization protein [Desulfobacterales bacterium]
MINVTREKIMSRLKTAIGDTLPAPPTACMPIATFTAEEKIEQLQTRMETMRTEVHVVGSADCGAKLSEVLAARKLKTLLYAPDTWLAPVIEQAWAGDAAGLPERVPFDRPIEDFKDTLFEVDAGITTTCGAIAETGAIVLWPDASEPRTLSLVPPVHIAVLKADQIYNSFCEIIQAQNWTAGMPTNALLISGPSKTADIEMTLAFGVHGPKELIVLILKD